MRARLGLSLELTCLSSRRSVLISSPPPTTSQLRHAHAGLAPADGPARQDLRRLLPLPHEAQPGAARPRGGPGLREPVPEPLQGVPALEAPPGRAAAHRGRAARVVRRARAERGRLPRHPQAHLPRRGAPRLRRRLPQLGQDQGLPHRHEGEGGCSARLCSLCLPVGNRERTVLLRGGAGFLVVRALTSLVFLSRTTNQSIDRLARQSGMVAAEAVFDWLASPEKQEASKEVVRYQSDMEGSWVRTHARTPVLHSGGLFHSDEQGLHSSPPTPTRPPAHPPRCSRS